MGAKEKSLLTMKSHLIKRDIAISAPSEVSVCILKD